MKTCEPPMSEDDKAQLDKLMSDRYGAAASAVCPEWISGGRGCWLKAFSVINAKPLPHLYIVHYYVRGGRAVLYASPPDPADAILWDKPH